MILIVPAGYHGIRSGNRPVELLVLGNRTCTFLVTASRFVGQAPHEDLVIICFNEYDNIGHDLAEHPFGKPGEVPRGVFTDA